VLDHGPHHLVEETNILLVLEVIQSVHKKVANIIHQEAIHNINMVMEKVIIKVGVATDGIWLQLKLKIWHQSKK